MQTALFAERTVALMQAEVIKHGLELMQRYPNDLLVHDRAILNRWALPGAKLAWLVGDSHTHIYPLGIHPRDNEMIPGLAWLCSTDRFYVVTFGSDAKLKEVSRDEFLSLSTVPVPYARQGDASGFWLLKNGVRVGYIAAEIVGNFQKRSGRASVTPVAGITALDMSALSTWADYAVHELAQTLFIAYSVDWNKSIALASAA